MKSNGKARVKTDGDEELDDESEDNLLAKRLESVAHDSRQKPLSQVYNYVQLIKGPSPNAMIGLLYYVHEQSELDTECAIFYVQK